MSIFETYKDEHPDFGSDTFNCASETVTKLLNTATSSERPGIWSRWQNYAKTGHGGNKLLKGRDPSNFQWSIVRTVCTTLSPRDVIRIEGLEKAKHGSRAIGLNGN